MNELKQDSNNITTITDELEETELKNMVLKMME